MTDTKLNIEHIKNGYILDSKDGREVVPEEKICQRIGELLGIPGLKQSAGRCIMHVQICTMEEDSMINVPIKDDVMKARKRYYDFFKPDDGTLAFLVKEPDGGAHFLFICKDADDISLQLGMKAGEKDGIHVLTLDARKETRKMIASFKPRVIDMTDDEIMAWYNRSNPAT